MIALGRILAGLAMIAGLVLFGLAFYAGATAPLQPRAAIVAVIPEALGLFLAVGGFQAFVELDRHEAERKGRRR